MKKNIICIIICSVLSLAFIAVGLLSLVTRDQKQKENEAALQQLQQQQAQLRKDTSGQKLTEAQNNNDALNNEIGTLTYECENLDESNAELQQQYDALSQDETNIYYMTVLESLRKGMEKVEGYIIDAQ